MNASLIFAGKVKHKRFVEKQHQFSYRVFMFYFDIAAMETAFYNTKQISIEKFNWYSFKRKNYLDHPHLPLDQAVREKIQAKTGEYPKGKIYLLTQLSCLNYCFNPLSLYFIFKENSLELDCLLLEVTNTPWGEKHQYILSNPTHPAKNIYQYRFTKKLHVSPFLDMNYDYQLNLKLDETSIIAHMENLQNGQLHFNATLSLHSIPLIDNNALKVFLRFPLMTFKITTAIYWQALKLWLKGVKFYAHPENKEL